MPSLNPLPCWCVRDNFRRVTAMLDVLPGTVVRMNGSGLGHHRKLTRHGGEGIVFAEGHLTQEEAAGSFTWQGTDGGRNALVRSTVSGREGLLSRQFFRKA
jgi:hypothetical protein